MDSLSVKDGGKHHHLKVAHFFVKLESEQTMSDRYVRLTSSQRNHTSHFLGESSLHNNQEPHMDENCSSFIWRGACQSLTDGPSS